MQGTAQSTHLALRWTGGASCFPMHVNSAIFSVESMLAFSQGVSAAQVKSMRLRAELAAPSMLLVPGALPSGFSIALTERGALPAGRCACFSTPPPLGPKRARLGLRSCCVWLPCSGASLGVPFEHDCRDLRSTASELSSCTAAVEAEEAGLAVTGLGGAPVAAPPLDRGLSLIHI